MEGLSVVFALVVALVGTPNQAVAQPSFAGTWKRNLAKSQLTGQTFSVEKTASGLLHFDMHAGIAFDFDLSGRRDYLVAGDQPDNLGGHEQVPSKLPVQVA
jgi:hypothetical protein